MSTRRSLLAGLAGVAATTAIPATAAVHPDATLIAIGTEAVPLLAEHDRHVAA